ncbi:TPA: hypothetical protein ACHD0I_001569, partial [Campylobacter jejuni]
SKIIKLDEHRIKKIKEKFLIDFLKNKNKQCFFNNAVLNECAQSSSLKDDKIIKALKAIGYIKEKAEKTKLFFSDKHPKLNEIIF